MVRAGNWTELASLIDDDMLRTFAVVGTPAEVAEQMAQRYRGVADRISPVVYQSDIALLSSLREEIQRAFAS